MFFSETLDQKRAQANPNTVNLKSDIHLAAATLMFKVIESDGDRDQMEVAHMVEILREHFSLSNGEIEELLRAARSAADNTCDLESLTEQLCRHWGRRERNQLLNDFWLIATADETIRKGERLMIDRIARSLQLEADDITRARYRAEQKLELNIA